MKLTTIIGLEIHVQLKTKSKMFCSCSNDGENQPPNTTVCPICLGHPGTLPVPNRQAIEWSLMASMALNCKIPKVSKFDRKNYFYPDLSKGYQISQLDQPLGGPGKLEIETDKGKKKIGITRLHLEEDAAKNTHSADGKNTHVDYNRGGTPLMEIVTEPDIRSAEDAKLLMQELRLIMRYLGVSDADMEKGHLRCDANISLTDQTGKIDIEKLKPKTEVKNINSFKAVEKALEYEIKRQTELWEQGKPPNQLSTRGWNENNNTTEAQRTKEEASDYRYFPEPDIPPLNLDGKADNAFSLESLTATMPELPAARRIRFAEEYEIGADEIKILTDDKPLADYTEQAISELKAWVKANGKTWTKERNKLNKELTNWLLNRLVKIASEAGGKAYDGKVTPENLAEFVTMIDDGKVAKNIAKQLIVKMYETKKDPSTLIEEEGLTAADSGELDKIIDKVITNNPKQVEQFKGGKETVLQFFVGMVMRETKGKADPQETADLLKKKLSN
ncbi:Asp-tRNA(Asn)/Glu-tRNA(Gln) amidotransferase GatCAB subunit B [bacterium]|nr:Asp-tRNA(Asn)/Glu-tRNA(Gln) amidotransferase GatCAB subunit B [bacterium]|tara:strand:+ start:4143 stop:5651 length:1509 start_codon:yes stop_codon:yes gene_type:complete